MHFRRLLFLLICSVVFLWNCARLELASSMVAKGVFEGKNWNVENPVLLTGEWEIYPGKLLGSEPELNQSQPPLLTSVPNVWNQIEKNGALLFPEGKGFATYRLHLSLPENSPNLMLRVPDQGTAYSVYVDGHLTQTVGQVGKTVQGSIPFLSTSLIYIPGHAKRLDFEISNFKHIYGGLWFPPKMGTPTTILKEHHTEIGIEIATASAMLVLAIYQIMVYIRTRNERSSIYFALFSIMGVLRFFLTGNRLFNSAFPDVPWEISYRLEYVSTYLMCSGFLAYSATSYPKDFNKRTELFSLIILAIFAIPALIMPVYIYANLLTAYQIITAVSGAYVFLGSARAVLHKRPGSTLFLIGIACILVAGANDILASRYVLNNHYILAPAILLFVFSRNLGFSSSFTHALEASHKAQEELQVANRNLNELKIELEKKVESRTQLLVEEKERAESEAKYRYDFLATMSHEIRTPLNGLLGTSNLLSESPLNPEQKEYADIIQTSGENLLHLVNQLLDLSKIENQRFSLEILPFDPFAVLQKAARVVKARAEEKRIFLNIDYPEHHPGIFMGDESRIQQVLLNLLSNSVKFTSSGGKVSLAVRFYGEDNFSRILEFWVEDNGVGIEKEQTALLFEPFIQGDNSVARKFGGSGLGLTISKKLVELMGGSIRLTSNPGKGSRFSFLLPFPQEELEKQELEEEPAPIPNFPSIKILLVEDQEFCRRVAQDTLTKLGMNLESVNSGKDALARLEETETFEIVFLDIDLPDMSGTAVAKKIKDMFGKKPYLVAWTAHALPGSEESFKSIGFDSYLKKPTLFKDWIKFFETYMKVKRK
ncbi:response regulator [Leptospira semungkisensis]|uniref:histidine kinase n=1 Tax=Leptospira semungkisensis TaxID=2484985 RepID=A0A4R9G837_9LEPT|nr:ATP-binding protein [Leptospira semungkisensis]TGK07673.1 response regulator [Leptospira semungkisensis]